MKQQKSYKQNGNYGQLYLVPTPIGNLEDMTYRAVRLLSEVQLIASEDTRTTQKLLNHFKIETPQISFHQHNYAERVPQLLAKLVAGENIAQVSDAGMPSISDPGQELVASCLLHEIAVIALPGATAGLTALIASGLPSDHFSFYGFLPRKKNDRIAVLDLLKVREDTLIFYESPHRLVSTISDIIEVFSGERKLVLSREISKIYEEYFRGTASEILDYLTLHSVKGECCILVEGLTFQAGRKLEEEKWRGLTLEEHVNEMIENNDLTVKEAIKQVARLRELRKQEVYKAYHIDVNKN